MTGRFHIAFATKNLDAAKKFYGEFLDCPQGRSGNSWTDYDFFGHQLTIQFVAAKEGAQPNFFHPKTMFPANHFGVILAWNDWHVLKDKITEEKVRFLVEPQTVFPGEAGEQKTMMIQDPDGNVIEFKSFEDPTAVFRS
ncbi:VOC family protein [Halocola ammonii]